MIFVEMEPLWNEAILYNLEFTGDNNSTSDLFLQLNH